MDRLADRGFEIIEGAEVVVVNRLGFEVTPVPLDAVEFRRVRSIPDRCQFLRMIGEKPADDLGVVNRAVVKEEVDVAALISAKEMLQKGDEVLPSLAVGQQERDTTGQGVQRAEDGRAAILTGGRDNALCADPSPPAAQTGIEMELAFVLEDEGTAAGTGGDFFKAAFRSRLARRTSFGFCLCLRESFGRL